ncbi:MAG: hypothetical protein IPP61_10130 [Cytophagaceae bacterium]|nr:hypothetical protein [Cytophagaceae bacterium]MBK9933589.1 hypothetical protein [Cytophagaceae bacterium]MBL0302698.1 hypothetical protein [Cytophagaceae bacterium]MBL0325521.1 hypothetical protein [Cytophagaceae bacterium]
MNILRILSKVFFLTFVLNTYTINATIYEAPEKAFFKSDKEHPVGKIKTKYRLRRLSKAYHSGFTAQKVVSVSKMERPLPELYLNKKYIKKHERQFKRRGAAFIVIKSWVESGPFDSFPPRKYCMLKTDMNKIIRKYKRTEELTVIENALGYSSGTLKPFENELFVFYINWEKYNFEIPNGTEVGANSLWQPGGLTSGGCKEAVLINKAEPAQTIIYNRQISNLQNQLRWRKINSK